MKRLEEFRIYYNRSIHPELMRLERLRWRLFRLLLLSAFLFVVLIVFQIYLDIFFIALLLSLPIGFYIAYLAWRIRQFKLTFKPHIMNLVLDFMNDSLNYQELRYDPKAKISKDLFLSSGIFATSAPYYEGEDYISGKVGEMDFALCEISVREISQVSNKLNTVFKGVFLYAIFNEEAEGTIQVWPKKHRQYLSRAIKAFTWEGGENVAHEIMYEPFREMFVVYATEDTHVIGILPEPMQEAIVAYVAHTGKDVYLAFHDQEIFAAVTEPKDILEPKLLTSNLNFEQIREYCEDISMMLRIVQDFDQTH